MNTPRTDKVMQDSMRDGNDLPDLARTLEAENNQLRACIHAALGWSNGRQCEWGSRAMNSFAFLEHAIMPDNPLDEDQKQFLARYLP